MLKQFQILLIELLYPKNRWIFVFDSISIVALFYIFSQNLDDNILAYMFYMISVYSLMITILYIYKITANIRVIIYNSHHVKKYYANIQYRMKIKLYMSLTINVLYAIYRLGIGILYKSLWDMHIGVYYFIICMVRMILLKEVNYANLGKNQKQELQKYKLCSYFLIVLNVVLTGVVMLMVYRDYTYQYPGYIIYIAAMYTFYTAISAIVNVVKFRKYHSPLINAVNIICVITALISILSLQTAMLTQFGSEGLAQKQFFNGLTGFVVCILIFVISISMIVYVRKQNKVGRT